MNLIRLALGNIYGVLVFALVILVLGGLAAAAIPVDILPAFRTPAVQVLTFFQGMPAGSVEKTITNRIERWVNQALESASSSRAHSPVSASAASTSGTTSIP